jgi:hypothetical protein
LELHALYELQVFQALVHEGFAAVGTLEACLHSCYFHGAAMHALEIRLLDVFARGGKDLYLIFEDCL